MRFTTWGDVIARVRGLASRLIGRAGLERLAASSDFAAFAGGLRMTVYESLANLSAPSGRAFEHETRRVAGDHTRIIASWSGSRIGALAPLFEDEDRRNLRSLARGVVAHAPPDQRVAGLLATPALPNAALEELAHAARLSDLAATLTAWGNSYGPAMMTEAVRKAPNLFALQLAIDREYALRAVRTAPHAGAAMVTYVRLIIDGDNATSALAVASGRVEHDPATLFVPGGELISAALFADLVRLNLEEATARLAPLLAATPLASLVIRPVPSAEVAMLTAMLRDLRRVVRRDPLSIAAVLEYVLALRAELHDLARIIWGIALDVPRTRVAAGLVTP